MDERTSPPAQPGKDWASCFPCHSNSTAWFHHPARFFYNYRIKFGQKSGVSFDDQLTFKDHIAKTARSCRFALHNIRKIRPFLTEHAAQLLVQALVISRLDYCIALLAGLPSCTIKPLQMIQNAAARLVFNKPKRAHVTPLFIFLDWLPVAACIKFKTLMLAYRTTTGSAPAYIHSLLRIYIPSRSLRSASERPITERHKITFQNIFVHCSWLVECSSHPNPECWFPDNFQAVENSSLSTLFDLIINKKNKLKKRCLSLYLFPPFLACTCLEQCLILVITSTSCVCLPL